MRSPRTVRQMGIADVDSETRGVNPLHKGNTQAK